MKLDGLVRSGLVAMLFAGAWTMGCGAESPEVPDDEDEDDTGGTGAAPQGGAFPQGGAAPQGGAPQGGVGPTGGFPSGGASGGGFPMGGTAAGGASGGGAVCLATPAVGAAADLLIDNLEDGNNTVGDDKMPPVRIGYWYTFKDTVATCVAMPPPDPSGATPFPPAPGMGAAASTGARLSGSGCTGPDYAAGIGFDVNNCNMRPNAYDGTAYNGIKFWYKSTTAVRFQIGTSATTPAPNGTCATECYDHHGLMLTAAPSGMDITIPFSMLNQEWTMTMTAFNKAQILNFQWQVKKEEGAAFDVTIDNIEFTP